jgi:hypothetical protein
MKKDTISIEVYIDSGAVYSLTVETAAAAKIKCFDMIKNGFCFEIISDNSHVYYPACRILKVKTNGVGW